MCSLGSNKLEIIKVFLITLQPRRENSSEKGIKPGSSCATSNHSNLYNMAPRVFLSLLKLATGSTGLFKVESASEWALVAQCCNLSREVLLFGWIWSIGSGLAYYGQNLKKLHLQPQCLIYHAIVLNCYARICSIKIYDGIGFYNAGRRMSTVAQSPLRVKPFCKVWPVTAVDVKARGRCSMLMFIYGSSMKEWSEGIYWRPEIRFFNSILTQVYSWRWDHLFKEDRENWKVATWEKIVNRSIVDQLGFLFLKKKQELLTHRSFSTNIEKDTRSWVT